MCFVVLFYFYIYFLFFSLNASQKVDQLMDDLHKAVSRRQFLFSNWLSGNTDWPCGAKLIWRPKKEAFPLKVNSIENFPSVRILTEAAENLYQPGKSTINTCQK